MRVLVFLVPLISACGAKIKKDEPRGEPGGEFAVPFDFPSAHTESNASIPLLLEISPECEFAVSRVNGLTNVHCQHWCLWDPENDFDTYCMLEEYVVEDRLVELTDPKCFWNWVYGHADGSEGAGTYAFARNAAECQLACQRSKSCMTWLFRAYVDEDEIPACILKSEDQTFFPISYILPGDLEIGTRLNGYKSDFCNMAMDRACDDGTGDCLVCGSDKSCVWKSATHLSGPKYCDGTASPCSPESRGSPVQFGEEDPCGLVFDLLHLQDGTGEYCALFDVFAEAIPGMLDYLEEYHEGSRYGASSFCDKPIDPFGYPGDYCYKGGPELGSDESELAEFFKNLKHSCCGGQDWPEAQLSGWHEGLMSNEVGWSDGRETSDGMPIEKVVFLITDAKPHYEGAMERHGHTDWFPFKGSYDCEREDYPSIEHLKEASLHRDGAAVIILISEIGGYVESSTVWWLLLRLGKIPGVVVNVSLDMEDLQEAFEMALKLISKKLCFRRIVEEILNTAEVDEETTQPITTQPMTTLPITTTEQRQVTTTPEAVETTTTPEEIFTTGRIFTGSIPERSDLCDQVCIHQPANCMDLCLQLACIEGVIKPPVDRQPPDEEDIPEAMCNHVCHDQPPTCMGLCMVQSCVASQM